MEACNHLLRHGGLETLRPRKSRAPRKHHVPSRTRMVMAPAPVPLEKTAGAFRDGGFAWIKRLTAVAAPPAPVPPSAYEDSWFDRLAIHYLSRAVQAVTGIRNEKEGYESLVEAAAAISKKFESRAQQELVTRALQKAFPLAILTMIKTLLPPSKFSREYFAAFTTMFFTWLIGPCEVRKSEVKGKTEKNVVYIPKCRFLERTSCVGMCTNLCKIPSQNFIQDSLGMPVYMVPNFEDMSCEMIFGQQPPTEDPALKQPCYRKSCVAKRTHAVNCASP